MPPFRFRLQQVLDYREQLEEQAKLAFARAKAAHEAQQRQVEAVRAAIAEAERKLYEDARLTRDELWLQRNFLRGLREDLTHAELRLRMLAQMMEQARSELVKKSQERKLLEKLKDKQAARHAHEELLREQRTYDETATLRFEPPSF